MTTKYDSVLLSKLISPTSINLLAKVPKTHPILKLLTYEHFSPIFQRGSNTATDYGKIIQKEIENRVYISKPTGETVNQKIKELAQELRRYYSSKYFSLNYILFYLCDVAEKARNLAQISDAPVKTSDQVLNDIERKVLLIQALDYYKTKSFFDRIQMTIASQDPKSTRVFEEVFHYNVIDKQSYDKLNFSDLEKVIGFLGNKRRQLGYEYGNYNYIPIICKKYCSTKSEELIESINHFCVECSCNICKEILKEQKEINDEIRVLYLKTCCFSHNTIEYDYHPYIYNTYRCECNDTSTCIQKHDDTIELIFIPTKIKDIRVKMNWFIDYIIEDINSSNNPTIKTKLCNLIQGTQYHDSLVCNYNHCPLEGRRNKKICYNLPCKCAIKEGKWADYSECNEYDDCPFYHTKNELFFDKRNYRKIYDCFRSDYCDYGEMCPYKHPFDIQIDEIYLPSQDKNMLNTKLNEIKETEKTINYIKDQLKQFKCCLCLRYDREVIYFNKKCKHFLCNHCKQTTVLCPLCLDLDNKDGNKSNSKPPEYVKFNLIKNREYAIEIDYSFNEGRESSSNDNKEAESISNKNLDGTLSLSNI